MVHPKNASWQVAAGLHDASGPPPRQATRLRAQGSLPGARISLACAVGAAAAVAPYLPTYNRGRSSEALCDPPYRATGGHATRDLFALLKPRRYRSSPAWCWRNSSIESQNPIDAALVPPLKRSGNVRHTLTALPALPELSLLSRCEPCPCIPLHAHTSSSGKIRRCCVDRLSRQPQPDIVRGVTARELRLSSLLIRPLRLLFRIDRPRLGRV
jgi:hypothetical protein